MKQDLSGCICGGAGWDGCRPRPRTEAPDLAGWRAAVALDAVSHPSLRDLVALDASRHREPSSAPRPDHLPCALPAGTGDLTLLPYIGRRDHARPPA